MLLMVFWFHLRSVRPFWEESDVSSSEVKVVEEGGRIVIRLAVLLWNYLISKIWLPGDLETGSLPCEGKTQPFITLYNLKWQTQTSPVQYLFSGLNRSLHYFTGPVKVFAVNTHVASLPTLFSVFNCICLAIADCPDGNSFLSSVVDGHLSYTQSLLLNSNLKGSGSRSRLAK